ncbi:hypothetical protein JCM8547_002354 [Rhodosporidiobolus lusitaniae]
MKEQHAAQLAGIKEEHAKDLEKAAQERIQAEVMLAAEYAQKLKEKDEQHANLLQQNAHRSSYLSLEQIPHDVQLVFPQAPHEHVALWHNSDFLSAFSPFQEALDFLDRLPSPVKKGQARACRRIEGWLSPSEGLCRLRRRDGRLLYVEESSSLEKCRAEYYLLRFYEVSVPRCALTTCKGLLSFWKTGHIAFAPLSSSFPSDTFDSRKDFLAAEQSSSSTSAPLEAFRHSLSPNNAARELFSDVSTRFEEISSVALQYVLEHWKDVKETQGWKQYIEKGKRRELGGGAELMVLVMLSVGAM